MTLSLNSSLAAQKAALGFSDFRFSVVTHRSIIPFATCTRKGAKPQLLDEGRRSPAVMTYCALQDSWTAAIEARISFTRDVIGSVDALEPAADFRFQSRLPATQIGDPLAELGRMASLMSPDILFLALPLKCHFYRATAGMRMTKGRPKEWLGTIFAQHGSKMGSWGCGFLSDQTCTA